MPKPILDGAGVVASVGGKNGDTLSRHHEGTRNKFLCLFERRICDHPIPSVCFVRAHAYERGTKAFDRALRKLAADPIRYAVVMAAFFPDMVREKMLDDIAEVEMTVDDVRELIRRVESQGRPN
jgi:hypothetical protein